MAVYWMTFRIANDANYEKRYAAVTTAINSIASKWWVEPTSFLLFESEKNIDGVVGAVKPKMGSNDLALIGMPDFKTARVIGKVEDQDLFVLMPFTKKA